MPNPRVNSQSVNPPVWSHRRDNIVPEAGQDPYRLAAHFAEPTVCPGCEAVYREGRWDWPESKEPIADAEEVTCPACRRIADGYCAGELKVSGAFVATHREDIVAVLRAEAKVETAEHPLHRIATLEEDGDGLRVVTTDVHLARRLGEALHGTFKGTLEFTYPPGGETVAVAWKRDDAHEPAQAVEEAAIPIEILGKGMALPAEAEANIRERIDRLHRFNDRILSCRVIVEAPEVHRRQGGPFAVSIQLEVPGPDIVVNRQQADDLRVAIRLAFEAAQRKLDAQIRKLRPEPPNVDERHQGRIARVFPAEGYGFLQTEDGHQVYFHRNSVIGAAFEALSIGERVRYVEEPGDKGPQATTVLARGMNRP